jgi:phage repressor protein C with HTH and peptisase S24 domain
VSITEFGRLSRAKLPISVTKGKALSVKAQTQLWQRIQELADWAGGIGELAERTGISYTTIKGAIDTKREGTNTDTAAKLVTGTGCSARWLLTGKGEMFEAPTAPATVVISAAPTSARYIHAVRGDPLRAEASEFTALRLLKDPVAAGPEHVITEDDIEGWGIIHRDWCKNPADTDYVRVKGDSMSPRIPDQSIVTIDKSHTDPADLIGEVVAIFRAATGGVTIKRLMRDDADPSEYHAVPDNIDPQRSDLRPFHIHFEQGDRIIGHVVTVHAKLTSR